MNKTRSLTKEVSFVLYGGGEVGSNCYKALKEQGYHVQAALDKNKSGEHIIEGLYTYKLGTEPTEIDKSECIIMICLANGMIHKTVADELYSLGYQYIVFLPMNYCIPDEQRRKLTRLYNCVLLADSVMPECFVSDYSQYAVPDMRAENSIICKTSQNITAWMRLEMLFSESLELWKGDKTKLHVKAQYKDKNIACAHPYETLFDFFALRSDSYDIYFDSRKEKKSPQEKERELVQREKLYRLFKKEYERGMAFFIESAPEVIWNPRNYFNLVGGHHRVLYLLHEGHSLFPVKMQNDDFDRWCNNAACQELKGYVSEHQIKQLYAPVANPCFLNFPAQCEDTGRTKLADIMRYLADVDTADMTVLDCGDDEGYFARNLDRIGAKESVFVNSSSRQTELAALLNQLLYRNDVRIMKGESVECVDQKKFDIVFAVNMSGMEDNDFASRIEWLGKICGQYLFVETTRTEEIDKIQAHTGLRHYECIHREYRAGKIWELGVYRR